MYLLHCKNCGDIYSLKSSNAKSCECGETGGIYENGQVVFFGDPYPIEVNDKSFNEALQSQTCIPIEEREPAEIKATMLPLRKPGFTHQ